MAGSPALKLIHRAVVHGGGTFRRTPAVIGLRRSAGRHGVSPRNRQRFGRRRGTSFAQRSGDHDPILATDTRTFTWVLPASTPCGNENEPVCEPVAKWYFTPNSP